MSPVNTPLAPNSLWGNDPSRASQAQGWGHWLGLPPQPNAGAGRAVLFRTQSHFLKLLTR